MSDDPHITVTLKKKCRSGESNTRPNLLQKMGKKLVFTKIREYITSYFYSELEVVYTDEQTGRAAKNMQYYISTHMTQAVLWCIQGRIFKCFQQ